MDKVKNISGKPTIEILFHYSLKISPDDFHKLDSFLESHPDVPLPPDLDLICNRQFSRIFNVQFNPDRGWTLFKFTKSQIVNRLDSAVGHDPLTLTFVDALDFVKSKLSQPSHLLSRTVLSIQFSEDLIHEFSFVSDKLPHLKWYDAIIDLFLSLQLSGTV